MSDQLEKLADEIATDLFRNGLGQEARRLVLELAGGLNGGGWCHGAVRDVILEHLRAYKLCAERAHDHSQDEATEAAAPVLT